MTDYIWTVSSGGTIQSGAGTHSIVVSWGGAGSETVTVTYASSSGPGLLDVTVAGTLTASVDIQPSANPSCYGNPVTFLANPVNGGVSPVYQWSVNGIPVGPNLPAFSYTPVNGDIVACSMTSSMTCVSNNPALAPPVSMTVSPAAQASVAISPSANPVCQGSQVSFTAVPSNGGSTPGYQWFVNGSPAGSNSPVLSYVPVNGDIVTCQMTSSVACATPNPALSNSVIMAVGSSQPVGVTIAASSNPSCQGSVVTFQATVVNGGTSPQYTWKVNGGTMGSGNPLFSYLPSDLDVVTCEVTSNASCAVGNPAISNPVSMSVMPLSPSSVTITANVNPVCQGSPVTFSATPVNGGATPSFQWILNGFNVGNGGVTYSYTPADGDVVQCRMVSSLNCTSGNPAFSNQVTMSVTPVLPVHVLISCSSNPVCPGTPVQFAASAYNGGSSPTYQWKVNGVNAGTNASSFTYLPADGDNVTCTLTSSAQCSSPATVVSNVITMNVSVNQTVEVTIAAAANPVCQGMLAEFTATPVNGGSSPAYQWKVNGVNAGSNVAFFTYIPADGDAVTCVMTSSLVCTQNNPATSNTVTMSVNQGQTLPVSVSIAPSANPSCTGVQVTFTATPVNGGSTPVYAWQVNGLAVGTNSPVYSYIPSSGDFVRCQLTSSYNCATGNPAMSNEISMAVNPVMTPSVSIVSSANPSCQGAAVTYTANTVNAGSNPIFEWTVNNVPGGLNQPTFSYNPVNGDVVRCRVTSSIPCPSVNPVLSNAITMTVYPVLPVSVSISTATNPSCEFTQVTFNATGINGGTAPVYQWKQNGSNVGLNSPTFIFIPVTGDVITCQMTSNAVCYSGNRVVVSNPIAMTVSQELPASVSITTGSNPFCQGATATLTATPTNGGNSPVYQWKVNCLNVGINTPTLNYIPANGDFVTCQMTSSLSCATMNPAISNAITMKMNTTVPAGISVTASANPVCQSSPVTLTALPVNGGAGPVYQWKVNNTVTGGNGPALTYTPVHGDVVTCRLTSNAPCVSGSPVTSAPVTLSTSASMPASVSISTLTNPFCAGSSVTFSATPQNGGASPLYQWQVNGVNAGAASTNASYSFSPTGTEVVRCLMTSNASCVSGSNPVTSNEITLSSGVSLAPAVSISTPLETVCQGTAVTFTAQAVNGGEAPVYQWFVNGVASGTNSSQFTCIPSQGDQVSCSMTSGLTCTSINPVTSNVVQMTVNPSQPVSATITASINPCCSGTSVTFTASHVNGGVAPTYQWKVNCQNVGTNSPVYTYTPVNGDVVVCIVASDALCATGSPAISNNINMVVLPMLPVSVQIATPVNPFCIGSSVTFTAYPANGGLSPAYQWKVNGVNQGTNSETFVFQPANGDVITCELTSSLSCISGNPALSNPIIMVGNTGLPVSVSIVSNWMNTNNTICSGTPVNFTATPTNGGPGPSYQWKVNGINQGTNKTTYEYQPANNDVITCQLTSNLNCASGNPAISNPITMTVHPNLPLSAVITASANPSCVGNTVNFTAAVTNGGPNPVYRWRVNGVNAGTNSPNFSYIPVNNDVVFCRVNSSEMCPANNPANSNSITMIVNPNASATVTISASANPVCAGTQVSYTAVPFNGGTAPAYQWRVNDQVQGTTGPTFIYTPVSGDVITCRMTSNSPCTPVTQVFSNPIIMTVSPIQPVSVSITASNNPTCISSPVTFTALAVNPGMSPVFQWQVNGIPAGNNNTAYTYIPQDGDVVSCKLTSNATCTTGNPAFSNTITMTVSESLPVSVSVSSSQPSVCQGQSMQFTASPVNGGTPPLYQWRVNGINVGTSQTTFSYIPSNGDQVTCQLTSSFSCGTGSPALSLPVTAQVFPIVPSGVSVVSSSNPVCQNTTVTFTANPINGGATPGFQWFVNNVAAGSNSPSFSYEPEDQDTVICIMTSSELCPIVNPVSSNQIVMSVFQPVSPQISIQPDVNPVCPGMSVTFAATIGNGGETPQFEWLVNGIQTGGNQPVLSYNPVHGDVVVCRLTSNANCLSSNTALSNSVVMVVATDLPVQVNVTPSSNPACQGSTVTFTASGVNGGSSPTYHWMVNNIQVGANDPTFLFSPVNGDVITCILTSNLTCATGNPATAPPVTMIMEQTLPVMVNITSSANPVCLGGQVVVTATAVNAGSSPIFQWTVNSVPQGANSPSFSYVPANGDLIRCMVTSSSSCAFGTTALSNELVIFVSNDLPVSVSISASANPVCSGSSVTFNSTVTNGGQNPSYQWKVNGNPTGTGGPTFTYIPVHGDVVTCEVTSTLACATGNPAVSGSVVMGVYEGQTASVSISQSMPGPVCQGQPVTFLASPVNGGNPTFQWFLNGNPTGTGGASLTFQPMNGDVVYVVMTSGLACVSGSPATSPPMVVTVEPLLMPGVTISADPPVLCEGNPATFTAHPVNGGTPSFLWYLNGQVAGTGPELTILPSNGDELAVLMTSSLACLVSNPILSPTISLVVQPALIPSVTIQPSQVSVCVGEQVTFTAEPVNGGSPGYDWFVNGLLLSTGSPVFTYMPQNGDQVYARMISSLPCLTQNPVISPVVPVEVNPLSPVSGFISVDQPVICQGAVATFSATVVNGGTPGIQWYVNGIPAGSGLPVFSYTPADGDEVHAVITSSLPCVSGSPWVSNSVTMTVIPPVVSSVSITASQTVVCEGTPVIFNAIPVNGGIASYQWYRNGLPTGSANTSYTLIPVNGDQVYVVMNSGLPCVTGNPAFSDTLTVTVNPILPVSVSIVADQTTVCNGTSVNVTAMPVNGGTPAYQWYKNGIPSGGNSPTFSFIPNQGDIVNVVMNSSELCATGTPATSNSIVWTVEPLLPVSVSVAASQNNVCQGTPVTYTATATNGGAFPTYQWYRNGIPAGANQPVLTLVPDNGDIISVAVTSSQLCVTGNPATSAPVVMVVNPLLAASVSISASQTSVCVGTPVTLTASPVNGGTPSFSWFVNNVPAGSNQPVYTYLPANGDLVHVTMTSSLACVSGSPAVSNTINLSVDPFVPVSVTINPDQNTICQGTVVTFTAIVQNGGAQPSYQWYHNGFPVGLNQPSYVCVPSDGDQVHCIVTSGLSCVSGNPATSNTVLMVVLQPVPVSVVIEADTNTVCSGSPVTLTSFVQNGGSPVYQWYVNNLPTGNTLPQYTYIPADGDQVHLQVTSSLSCVSGNPAISNILTIDVLQPVPASVVITVDQSEVCAGTPVTFTAMPLNGGTPVFEWFRNEQPAGSGGPTFTMVPENGDRVYARMHSSLSCVIGSPAVSNQLTILVNPLLPVEVQVVPDQTEVCQGTPVHFTAIVSNGGNPLYQWFVNNQPAGTSQPAFTYIPENGDSIHVIVTSTAACVTGNPAVSSAVSIQVNPLMPVSVTISGDKPFVCPGEAITFRAQPVNGGMPSYTWLINGVPAGTHDPEYSFVPSDGDQVAVVMTSSLNCTSGNPATSGTVVIEVRSIPGDAETISGPVKFCSGVDPAEFFIPGLTDADNYEWLLPDGATLVAGAGTPKVTLAFAVSFRTGTLRVRGLNACGAGEYSPPLTLSQQPTPSAPDLSLEWPWLTSSADTGNQWYFEGEALSGATGKTYQAAKTGWYWCIVTLNGCPSDSSQHVFVSMTDPGDLDPEIVVYPVPNDGRFHVSIIVPSKEVFSMVMYDQTGRVVFEQNGLVADRVFKDEFDLRPLPRGVYSIRFKSDIQEVVKRVIILKK